MKLFAVIAAAVLLVPVALEARGAEPGATGKEPKKAELSAEQSAKLEKLIRQLGHEEWAKREAAAKAIRKFGKAALPALKKAAGDEDQEIASRAQALIEKLNPPKPRGPAAAEPGGVIRIGGGMGARIFVARAVAVAGPGGGRVKSRSISGPEGTVTITETDSAVTVTVVSKDKDAKPKTYTAKTRAEFKKKHKAVYMKYLASDAEKKAAAEKPAKKKPAEGKADEKKADADRERALIQKLKGAAATEKAEAAESR